MAVGGINEGFFYKKLYGPFAAPKNTGRNNEVTVLPRFLVYTFVNSL